MQLFLTRQLALEVSKSSQPGSVIISTINPGHVRTDILREATVVDNLWMKPANRLLGRTTEVGGRTLVNAAEGGKETHGQYLDDCKVGE